MLINAVPEQQVVVQQSDPDSRGPVCPQSEPVTNESRDIGCELRPRGLNGNSIDNLTPQCKTSSQSYLSRSRISY